jgi:flagellar motor switch protein FliM
MAEEEILSEDELNDLTSNDGSNKKEELYDQGEVHVYNFHQPEHTKRGHFPTLQIISDKTAKLLRDNLEFMLQQKIEVHAQDITINKFGEFVNSLNIPIDIKKIKVPQLDGNLLICFDNDLINLVIEEYFGAPDVEVKPKDNNQDESAVEEDKVDHIEDLKVLEKEEFTTAESRISKKILSYLILSMKDGWSLLGNYDFVHEQSENDPKLINYLDHNELIVNINYEIYLRSKKSIVRIGVPYKILDKVKHHLRRVVQSTKKASDQQWMHKFYEKLQIIPMEVVGELSKVKLPVKKLVELKIGDVINFSKPENITIYVNKTPVLVGHVGESNGQAAILVDHWVKTNDQNYKKK